MGFSILVSVLLIACSAVLLVNASPSYPSHPSYESCSPYTCGDSLIKYPFNDCAFTSTECRNNESGLFPLPPITLLGLPSMRGFCSRDQLRVIEPITESSYTNRTTRVACDDMPENYCSVTYNFVTWFDTPFYLSDKYKWGIVLMFKSPPPYSNLQPIECSWCKSRKDLCFFLPSESYSYTTVANSTVQYGVVIPSNKSYNITNESNLRELLRTGSEIKWIVSEECYSCEASGGICYQSLLNTHLIVCLCPDGPRRYHCSHGILHNQKKQLMTSTYKAAIGVLSGAFITSTIIFAYIRIKRKKRGQEEEQEQQIREYMDPLDTRPPSVENFLQGGIPSRYSYRQIKRYTNNFVMRLGQGGFGTVFKGELPNGCMVAIKILDESKNSRIQFMNEVATIGRIHHLHLVRLLGYCFEGSKRALIYEYMVNGSLEKYILGDDQNVLNWKQLYSIAIGTARGIAYLHDECRRRILHCDIKPHNVLLDANFSPKVADFGLAKLTDREESHVSLTGARGTPGYVAPEVWSRSIGPVTDRSDVYSYGMLVMEMVGGRKNLDMKASRSSKFYYPEWAFKQVEMGEFRNLRGENIADDEDEVIAKKLSMLGLWCIQYNPSQRPSMSRVIQMLEGAVDIDIPPQPFPVGTSVQTAASTESSSSM